MYRHAWLSVNDLCYLAPWTCLESAAADLRTFSDQAKGMIVVEIIRNGAEDEVRGY